MDQPSPSEADAWRPEVGRPKAKGHFIHLQFSKQQAINFTIDVLFDQKTGRQGKAADQERL